jgi:K+-sensing histidine kinase KdpD
VRAHAGPYSIGVSVASVLAFNFFFLPPLHTVVLTRRRFT